MMNLKKLTAVVLSASLLATSCVSTTVAKTDSQVPTRVANNSKKLSVGAKLGIGLICAAVGVGIFCKSLKEIDSRSENEQLMDAIKDKNCELIKTLIARGTNPNCKCKTYTNYGVERLYTPLEYAVYEKNTEAVEILIEQGAKIDLSDSNGRKCFFDAIGYGMINVVKFALESNPTVDINSDEFIDCFGCWPIHCVCKYCSENCVEILQLLIEHGAKVDRKSRRGETLLYKLVSEANPLRLTVETFKKLAEILIDKKPNIVNICDDNGTAPLDFETSGGGDRIKELRDTKREFEYGDEYYKEIFKYLKEKGAKTGVQLRTGQAGE